MTACDGHARGRAGDAPPVAFARQRTSRLDTPAEGVVAAPRADEGVAGESLNGKGDVLPGLLMKMLLFVLFFFFVVVLAVLLLLLLFVSYHNCYRRCCCFLLLFQVINHEKLKKISMDETVINCN